MAVGDITYTNPGGHSVDKPFASGTLVVDADVAANIIVGFQPSMIRLDFVDAGNTYTQTIVWYKGMTAASYYSTLHSSGAITTGASGGPIVYAGSLGEGFTIPAGFPANLADSDTVIWQAWR